MHLGLAYYVDDVRINWIPVINRLTELSIAACKQRYTPVFYTLTTQAARFQRSAFSV